LQEIDIKALTELAFQKSMSEPPTAKPESERTDPLEFLLAQSSLASFVILECLVKLLTGDL
jgi:hypothetical protein